MRKSLVLCALVAGCSNGPTFTSTCTAGAPSDEALAPAGRLSDGSVILPDGRKLTPAGKVLQIGGFPVSMRVLPGDRYVVVSDADYGDEYLRIVDTQAADSSTAVVSAIAYPFSSADAHSPALFYGLALTKDGKTLYVSDGAHDPVPDSVTDFRQHHNVIEVFSVGGTPPSLTRTDEIDLPFSGTAASPSNRLPAGLALSADEKTLYVANQGDGTLSVVDLSPGATQWQELGRTPALGVDPYDVSVVSPSTVLVSLWGGANSGGGFHDGVQAVDVSQRNAPMPKGALIPTEKASEAMLDLGGKTYVTAADGDQIAVIDDATLVPGTAASTAFDATGLPGSTPNALAVDSTRDRLYVANAGENAVQAFQLSTLQPLGRVPAGWYPTAVATLSDGTLLIASAKGLGSGPTDHPPGKNDYMQGTLQVVPPPSAADLMTGDAAVHDNLTRPRSYEVALTCQGATRTFPLPPEKGAATPIQHTFLIVRENKTYDAVLGDLPGTNGDPSLALFGGDTTPNLHALAQRFTNLDNFYSLAEQSLQGHEWTTASMANDYTEKGWLTTWGRYTRPLTTFSAGDATGPLVLPKSPTLWKALDAAAIPYHNYGEIVNTTGALTPYDTDYPGVFFNLNYLDVDKIAYVIQNVQDRTFALEPFSYVGLPNDHTQGTSPGKPTPQSMIADNDEATGRFIDALSHSDYWKSSIVFVIEDDPSDGGDHVELHRSPCVVISPWVKAGYDSSVHYDVPALYRTLTLLLGIDPLNQRDGNAAAMYDVFSTTPDLRPYTFIPRVVPATTNSVDAPLAAESARIDWSQPDRAPLGRILWKAVKGGDAEPPWGTRPVTDGDD
jgi:DNA-binding beta-propeller fold protein YncE